jgi:peroxiredoxin
MRLRSLEGATDWLNGGPVDVERVDAPVVLVHFFAVSCQVCEDQLPAVAALANELRPKGLVTVGVHTLASERDTQRACVEAAVRAAGLVHPVALDMEGRVSEAYDVVYVPSYFVFDRSHALRHYRAGYDALGTTRHTVERLLEGEPARAA